MKTEDLGNSKILNLIFKLAGILMGSKVRECEWGQTFNIHLIMLYK